MPRVRSVLSALLLTLALVVPPTSATLAQSNRSCFPNVPSITNCIHEAFQQYWEQNGGLQVFGYPITPAVSERNRDTGQSYLTQWFERNRLELHPENPPPYRVQLGRLGDDRLRQLNREWQREPKVSPTAPHFFAETGHAISHQPFWQRWSSQGLEFDGRRGTSAAESLALFGLPLTEPREETNAAGDTVLTQWFERARFEWHPNNPDPYKVLFGLLGNEVRSGTVPPSAPPPTFQYPQQPAGLQQASVVTVVDGDTVDINLAGQVVRLRLIGMDTPETVDPRKPVQCFGQEASAKAKDLLTGKTVYLEADPSQDKRDAYDRLLRYIWLPGGKLFNLDMIGLGYAHEYTYQAPYKYQSVFREAERLAREADRGLWSPNTCNGDTEQPAPGAPGPAPAPTPTLTPRAGCDVSYPTVCIPPPPPDLDCGDIPYRRFPVVGNDPHRLDGDNDGVGCES